MCFKLNEAVLEMSNVTKTYGNVVALNAVNLSLKKGSIVGLLGPNGSGKTTMLKLFMRIIRPQMGSIKVYGNDISYETRKYISFMPDREYLYSTMKVRDAIEYYKDMFEDFDVNKAYTLCQKLGLMVDMDIPKLSKGNREKVVLMLTLSRNVPIYLLDEPLGSLDPLIKHEMLNVIKEASTSENIILISTHLIKDTEEILDDVVFLRNGNVLLYENKDKLTSDGKGLEEHYIEVFSHV